MKDKLIGDIISHGEGGDVVLVGFPHDKGVELNGGRVGAKMGPEKFRAWLGRYGVADNPETDENLSLLTISDAGDVPAELSLKDAHVELTRQVESILRFGGIPFVVGGGNDQSYANARALLNHVGESEVGVINIDAHLDVRPLIDGNPHSGSPFRLLLEDQRFNGENFIEFAAQGSRCSREHTDYVRNKKGRIFWLDEVQSGDMAIDNFQAFLGNLGWRCDSLFVSFDLDSMSSAEAPGVSCPGILGLTAREAVSFAYWAGRHPKVTLFDLSEYNPEIEEERTGGLAVAIFYHFCLGVLARREKPS